MPAWDRQRLDGSWELARLDLRVEGGPAAPGQWADVVVTHPVSSVPRLTQSSVVIRLDAGSSNKSDPSSDLARAGMSTLAYVGFAGAIARGEATVGHARSPSSLPREARTTQSIPCHGGVLKKSRMRR